MGCLHLIISSVLLYSFTSKLLELIYNSSRENLDNNRSQNMEFTIPQQSILNVVTKQLILSATVIVSSQIYQVTNIIIMFFVLDNVAQYKAVSVFNRTLFAVD